MKAADWVWYGTGTGPAIARAMLRPAALVYSGAVAARGLMYERGLLHAEPAVVPALSIGNLSVGGTGKTPVAAWAAERLRARGARPAIVLRGYGDDEPLVHARLNAEVPVIVSPVRAEGIRQAAAKGCDVVVLDDAFQHRRVTRMADWVLVSADRWSGSRALLPAGPWREPLSALRRATIAVVTRKAATPELATEVRDRIALAAPGLRVAVVSLELDALRATAGSTTRGLDTLAGTKVNLISGIGDPSALRRQLEQRGATVRQRAFPDHHAFTATEIAELARSAAADETVVCTLKDAVKLAPQWPRAGTPLWYVSQRVNVEEGVGLLEGSLDALLHARAQDSDAVRSGEPYL